VTNISFEKSKDDILGHHSHEFSQTYVEISKVRENMFVFFM